MVMIMVMIPGGSAKRISLGIDLHRFPIPNDCDNEDFDDHDDKLTYPSRTRRLSQCPGELQCHEETWEPPKMGQMIIIIPLLHIQLLEYVIPPAPAPPPEPKIRALWCYPALWCLPVLWC